MSDEDADAYDKIKSDCHHSEKIGYVAISGGGSQYKKYCELCGEALSNPLPKPKDHLENEIINVEELRLNFKKSTFERQKGFILSLKSRVTANEGSIKEQWGRYLTSDTWQAKRKLVFERANYKCEGCGMHPAQEIHHLTYERRFFEMLFDLVALCPSCHSLIHFDKNKSARNPKMYSPYYLKCSGCRHSGENGNINWCEYHDAPMLAALKSPYLCADGRYGYEGLK